MTQWRRIVGWPYEVSDDGQVRRAEPGKGTYVGRILKPSVDRWGYKFVQLCDAGRPRTHWIARLVCCAFHGDPPSKHHQVRHLDGHPRNNNASNLCWGLPKENIEDKNKHGTMARGERHGIAKITNCDVIKLREEANRVKEKNGSLPKGWRHNKAKELGVSAGHISNIVMKKPQWRKP